MFRHSTQMSSLADNCHICICIFSRREKTLSRHDQKIFDLWADGIMDTVNYRLSDVSEASGTTNPNDKIFYRWSNSEPQIDAALGVTNFQLRFFDASGDTTSNQVEIRTIEVTLEFESTEPYFDKMTNAAKYAHFYWREKISPMNLQPL